MQKGRDPRARFFAALATPSRLAIVELLTAGERSVGAVVSALDLDPSVVSRHLGLLLRAGILVRRRTGVRTFYQHASPRIASALRLATRMTHQRLQVERRALRAAAKRRR